MMEEGTMAELSREQIEEIIKAARARGETPSLAGIDLSEAVAAKMAKNEIKYPAPK